MIRKSGNRFPKRSLATMRSGCGRLRGLLRLRLLAYGGRPDVHWRAGRCRRRFIGVGAKKLPAWRRELRLSGDHAGRDAVDIRDFGTTETKGVGLAGLLLLRRVGVTDRWQRHEPQHSRDRRATLTIPKWRHEIPHALRELWVNRPGLASRTRNGAAIGARRSDAGNPCQAHCTPKRRNRPETLVARALPSCCLR
jgi:hypothetical protein